MESDIKISIFLLKQDPNLKNCLNSLIAQTLHEIEIFYVDSILNDEISEYIKDNNVQFIKINEKDNINLNELISKAKGKYVFFAENENLYKKESFETFYNISEKNKLDLLIPINKENTFFNYKINIDPSNENLLSEDSVKSLNCKEIIFEDILNYDLDFKNILINKELITKYLIQKNTSHTFEKMMLHSFFNSKSIMFIDDYLILSLNRKNKITDNNDCVLLRFILYDFVLYNIVFKSDNISKKGYYQHILSNIYDNYRKIDQSYKKLYLAHTKNFLLEYVVLQTLISDLNSDMQIFYNNILK